MLSTRVLAEQSPGNDDAGGRFDGTAIRSGTEETVKKYSRKGIKE
jgi:hypothetical protein